MKKTDKKIDNSIRSALTEVCEQALKDIAGFEWLTHLVNYQQFPNSLSVVCVFGTNEQLAHFKKSSHEALLISLIKSSLTDLNINLKHCKNLIEYDTEENCKNQHNGNWAQRFI